VRWDLLFADLAAQGEALERAELDSEVAERLRGEVGELSLVDRARAAVGAELRLRLRGGLDIAGRLTGAGPDWLLLAEPDGREVLVASGQLISVRGLPRSSAAPGSAGVVESRIGVRQLLRAMARDRSPVRAHLVDGSALDATVDRVGADFLELATHPPGEPRRRADVRDVATLPLSAIVAVRRSV
jgi:hypothetical protein